MWSFGLIQVLALNLCSCQSEKPMRVRLLSDHRTLRIQASFVAFKKNINLESLGSSGAYETKIIRSRPFFRYLSPFCQSPFAVHHGGCLFYLFFCLFFCFRSYSGDHLSSCCVALPPLPSKIHFRVFAMNPFWHVTNTIVNMLLYPTWINAPEIPNRGRG